MAAPRMRDGHLFLDERLPQRPHRVDPAAHLGFDEFLILQGQRDALPVDHVQRLAIALQQCLESFVQRRIVGRDHAALVDAEVLRQTGDHGISLRQQFRRHLPQRGVAPFRIVFDDYQRVF